MLDSFRKASKSWLAKALLSLLIVSFGAWGIGDFLTSGGEAPPAIVVGDVHVGTEYLRTEFNRDVSALRQRMGGSLTTEQAIQLGLLDRTIGRVITDITLSQTAADWGIVVPDTAVAKAIRETPAFQSGDTQADRHFDRALYERLLALNGLSEKDYVQSVRNDLIHATVTEPVVAGATAPAALVDALYRFHHEMRAGESVAVTIADMPLPEAGPDDSTLETLYQDNLDRFTAPEYRAVTAIVLGEDQARSHITISDEAIAEAYAQRQEEFTQPDRRLVSQVLVGDEATAQAVVDAARAGADLATAAAEAGAPAPKDMGEVAPGSLPGDLGAAVFALDVGAVSDPVKSAFGWHVFRVRDDRPGGVQPLDAVRDTLREELVQQRVMDTLYDLSVQVDDALGGGATLEQAAESLGVDLLTVEAVDAQGNGPDGQPVPGLPEASGFLSTVFSADDGETSLMQETGRGYFVVRIDSTTPAAPRPLEAVRDQLMALWAQRQQETRANDVAKRIAAAAGEVSTLEAAAGVEGLSVAPLPAVYRDGRAVDPDSRPIPGQLVQALFDMDKGDLRVVEAGSAVYVVRLTQITQGGEGAGDGDDTAAAKDTLARQLGSAIADDLYVEFTDALSRRLGVTVNRPVIQDAF